MAIISSDTIKMRVGNTLPVLTLPITPKTGTFVTTGLSASNFTLIFVNQDTQKETTGTGTFLNLTAASGTTSASIQYHLSSTDTSVAGEYTIMLSVLYPNTNETSTAYPVNTGVVLNITVA